MRRRRQRCDRHPTGHIVGLMLPNNRQTNVTRKRHLTPVSRCLPKLRYVETTVPFHKAAPRRLSSCCLKYTRFMIRQIVPVFFTMDIPRTVAYYKDKLGFECLETWMDPPVYAI